MRSTVKSITQKISGETTASEYRVPQSGPWEGCDLCYSVPGTTTRILHHPTSAHCLLLEHAWFLVEVPDGLTQVGCFPGRLEESDLAFVVGGGVDSEIHSSVKLELAYKGSCQNYRDL